MPDQGERLGELINKYPGTEIPGAVDAVPCPNPDDSTGSDLYLKADKFRGTFAAGSFAARALQGVAPRRSNVLGHLLRAGWRRKLKSFESRAEGGCRAAGPGI
ncbi:hypothetical protein [Streptomyces mirabilis]|uniref:hypothetical protein n=1 Tax=Streptomyces mirabilis TaxID=68239 RepID=UPI0036DB4544